MFAKRRGIHFSTAAVAWCALGLLCNGALGQTNPITNGSISVRIKTVATLPTGTTGAPDFLTTDGVAGDARLFVLGQRGQIRIVDNGTQLDDSLFGREHGAAGNVHIAAEFVGRARTVGAGVFARLHHSERGGLS